MTARRRESQVMQLSKNVALCRRLAQGAVPVGVVEELESIAREYERQARSLGAASVQTQGGQILDIPRIARSGG